MPQAYNNSDVYGAAAKFLKLPGLSVHESVCRNNIAASARVPSLIPDQITVHFDERAAQAVHLHPGTATFDWIRASKLMKNRAALSRQTRVFLH